MTLTCWKVCFLQIFSNAGVDCVEFAEACALCTTRADFDRALAHFMVHRGKRDALVGRLVKAGLWKKPQ